MDLLKSTACQEIEKQAQELTSLSTRIWTYAEQGGKEVRSSEAIIGFLVSREFTVTKHYRGIKTAFKAEFGENEFGGKKKPNICLVCRYDAVRKKGHVNGNNLVVQATVAAALGLKAVIRASSSKIGKVTLLGCPNSGKGWLIKLLNRKAFKDIDVLLTAAPGERTEWDPTYVASKTYRATYTGSDQVIKEASFTPATSALDAAVYAYTNILAMREHFGKGWNAEGVISRGGHVRGQTPKQCETTIKITGHSDKDLALLERRILPCFDAAAQASGCELELVLGDKSYRSMISNKTLVYLLQLNAYYCGILSTPMMRRVTMTSVDVANVSRIIPAVRPVFYIGSDVEVGTDEFKAAANSQTAYWYGLCMGKTLAMTAIDYMETSLTMHKCKQDLVDVLRQEKDETTFTVFPINQVTSYAVPMAAPMDSNIGWSQQV